MRNGGGLPRGKCSELRGAGDLACSGIRREGRFARVTHFHLAANPSPRCLYRPTGSTVVRSDLLEVMKHMLCAVGRPKGQELVVAIRQSATATHGNESRITLRRQDYARHSRLRQDGVLRRFIVSRAVAFGFTRCDAWWRMPLMTPPSQPQKPARSSRRGPRMRASGRQCRPTGRALGLVTMRCQSIERLTSIPVPAAVGRLNCQSMRSSRVYTDHSPMSTQRRSALDCRAAAMTCSVRKPSVNVGRSG
jgi:hypothetical protein